MIPAPAPPNRARSTALGLLAGIGLVLLIQLVIGIPTLIVYGLIGGLLLSLVIVGLDLLHTVERTSDAPEPPAASDERER